MVPRISLNWLRMTSLCSLWDQFSLIPPGKYGTTSEPDTRSLDKSYVTDSLTSRTLLRITYDNSQKYLSTTQSKVLFVDVVRISFSSNPWYEHFTSFESLMSRSPTHPCQSLTYGIGVPRPTPYVDSLTSSSQLLPRD